MRSKLQRLGTGITATTVMKGHVEDPGDWPDLEAEVLRAGELGAELGARHMVLIDDFYSDQETPQRQLGEDSWKRLIDATHRVADLTSEKFGLPIAFHGHSETHVETTGQLESLLQETDPDRVSLCLDTGHHAFCGGDVVSFLRRHHDRVSYMHFKNVDPGVFEHVRSRDIPLATATEQGVFCALSDGIIDYGEVAEVLRETEYDGWVIVENDQPTPTGDESLVMARYAREYLRDLGIGESRGS